MIGENPVEFTVELRDITKKYGDVTAVDKLSFRLRRGEFFSLLGPSGCGKTTTLRLIAGFEKPTEGRILLNNEDVIHKRPYERNVNTVFQSYALFPHLTVAGNISFGLERKKTPRLQIKGLVDEILDLVRLEGMGSRYPRQLSGGQQQRVALARALVLHPDVLLLDEPLGALDLKLRKEMQFELKSLQEKVGITFLYVTHDQEEALILSDRIAIMEKGSLVQTGTPEEIYEAPRTRFVADFIGVSNFFNGRVVENRSEDLLVETDGGLNVILPATGNRVNGQALSFSVRPEKISVISGESNNAWTNNVHVAWTKNVHAAWTNKFHGRIVNKSYLGGSVSYVISLSDKELVSVDLKNERRPHKPAMYSPGDSVMVAWHKDDCIILSD